MAARSRPWVAAAMAAVLVASCGCRDHTTPDAAPVDFSFAEVPTSSPQLAVETLEARGVATPGVMTSWEVLLVCREPDGCAAQVELSITYRSGGSDQRVVLAGRLEAAAGGRARLARVERPGRVVDSVERVEVRVVERSAPGAPRPTPML